MNKTKMLKRIIALLMLLCLSASFAAIIPTTAYAKGYVVVVIDAGHGGDGAEDETDLGAVYDTIGKNEKDINLITAKALYDELDTYRNVQIYMTRDDDSKMSIKERMDFAKKKKADVFISCHYNASETHRFYGSEIFTSAYGEYYAYGQSLASCIEDEWKAKGMYVKGTKTRLGEDGDYYGVIRQGRENKIPALILEHGYLDNEVDANYLDNEEKWKEMGIADATAIAKFYGLEKEKQPSVSANITVDEVDEAVPDTSAPGSLKLTINNYDYSTGEVKYSISAEDKESKLYLYGMEIEDNLSDSDSAYMNLATWDEGKESMSGFFYVEPGYTGNVSVRVYNIYELYTDTPLVKLMSAENIDNLPLEDAVPEPEEDAAAEVIKIKPENAEMIHKLSVIGAVVSIGLLICVIIVISDRKKTKF